MSLLELELRDQADVLAARSARGAAAATAAGAAAELLGRGDVEHLVIAARGSSDNAARYAQYLLGLRARLPVGLAAPWLYGGERPPLLRGAAVLGISQSGRSPDIVGVLAAARAQGRPTLAITNDPKSPLAAVADVVVPLLAGEERSVAATKTYLASLHAVAQIASALAPADWGPWFDRLPELVSAAVDDLLARRSLFDPLASVRLLTVVGRGLELATAFETALKVRELSGIAAEAFSVPDLLHGPVAALNELGAVWMVAGAGRGQPTAADLEALRRGGGLAVVVSGDRSLLAGADLALPMPAGAPDWLAPMLAVLPGQVAALRLGELRGVDLDRPHGLHKVTLTR
jgi:glutamine---fructose-6-phosphate transaminase (isomerizing)